MKLSSLYTVPAHAVSASYSYVKSFFVRPDPASVVFADYQAMMDKIKADIAPVEQAAGDHKTQAAQHTAQAAELDQTIDKAKTLLANLETLTTKKIVS